MTKAQIDPQRIWEPETEAEKEAKNPIPKVIDENIVLEVQKEKKEAKLQCMVRQSMSFYGLKNAEVDAYAYNAQHREVGLGKKERKQRIFTAQRPFKQEKLEKRGERGGIDGFGYQREILVPISLFPLMKQFKLQIQMSRYGLSKTMPWLIHAQGVNVEKNRRLRKIQKCEWPPEFT